MTVFEMTPIVRCKTDLPINLYIKREDLIPFSFGGNKVRIANEFYSDMIAKGKNCMVGYGNARSNLSRALANMSTSKGKCYIISPSDDDGVRVETGNSRIVKYCGAEIRYCTKQNVAETVDKVMAEISDNGLKPYYIYGNKYGKGNEEVPIRAYYKVYKEIKKQEEILGVEFDYIFLATGTGMTQAGLLVGKRELLGREKIIGVSVAREAKVAMQVIKTYINSYEKMETEYVDINILDEYLAGGYGKYNEEIVEIIYNMMKRNGIPLDPTYTGKAFWGMTKYIQQNGINSKNVLFIHTGGTPLFFDFLNNKFLSYNIKRIENNEKNRRELSQYFLEQSEEFAVPLLNRVNPNEYAEKVLHNGYVFAVLDIDKRIKGVICGYANDKEKKVAYESSFVVSADFRGTNAAKDLFEQQKQYCKEKGMNSIMFTTNCKNIAAVKFYQKMGVPKCLEKSNEEIISYKLDL